MTILKNRSLLLPATEEDRRRRRTEKEEEEEGRRRNQLTALKRVVSVFATDARRVNQLVQFFSFFHRSRNVVPE